jgi:rhamnulose-1-phosphate aldolase
MAEELQPGSALGPYQVVAGAPAADGPSRGRCRIKPPSRLDPRPYSPGPGGGRSWLAVMLDTPVEIDALLHGVGEAGRRMAEIEASEGAAGNISVCVRGPLDPRARFPVVSTVELPQAAPELAGACLLVTGAGRRLREIVDDPTAHVGCIVVDADGRTGRLHTSHRRRFERVTSEFNSHLAVHDDQVRRTGARLHAIIHAQPIHLTYLSHVPRYRDVGHLNSRLLRWQPETIVNLPEGIGVVPFQLPGSTELVAASVESLREHQLVIWAKHGVMARSAASILRAADLVEYAEIAARYEFLDLSTAGSGEGLSVDELQAICRAHKLQPRFF